MQEELQSLGIESEVDKKVLKVSATYVSKLTLHSYDFSQLEKTFLKDLVFRLTLEYAKQSAIREDSLQVINRALKE